MLQPASLRAMPTAQAELAALNPDLLIVVAYGLILPQAVLDIPATAASTCTPHCCRAGAVPHRSSVPLRPATRETGITIMQMEAGLDTGPMLASVSVDIGSDMTPANSTTPWRKGYRCWYRCWTRFPSIWPPPRGRTTALATYAAKLEKAEAEIDWQQSAAVLDRQHPCL